MKPSVSVFWFRRDLRLEDNAGLYHALRSGSPVLPIFIFDRNILDKLDDKADRRVEFIHTALVEMQAQLVGLGSSLEWFHNDPPGAWRQLLSNFTITGVFANEDYEPYARDRDESVKRLLSENGVVLYLFKDQVIFSKEEVRKDDGQPYTVYTPYRRRWMARWNESRQSSYPTNEYHEHFYRRPARPLPPLEYFGFIGTGSPFPRKTLSEDLLAKYADQRDYPGIQGTSRLGVHLRFGTCSIRDLVRRASAAGGNYLNELIWREFYQMILWHFPEVGKGKSFKPAYDWIRWRNKEDEFEKWRLGMTGYPIVDAGMRELNSTGFMHNRVRMIVASFLTRHLLIDWRWGEAWFAAKLLDFDLAANNGGWQWAAGCGCDAAPYFRVFNPELQTRKFDLQRSYVSRWVPEFQSAGYPRPVVDHAFARKRALEVYRQALQRTTD
ncbi:MAG: deoxyribodipyrimidine photo-lyase [Bacteroidota bacterium]|nr:deoxyribodipyrimidine photo-lyase [Bacteroidota bacterium]